MIDESKFNTVTLLVLVTIFLATLQSSVVVHSDTVSKGKKRILVLNSMESNRPLEVTFNTYFKDQMASTSTYEYKLSFEALDLVGYSDKKYRDDLANLLHLKYGQIQFDAVVCTLPQASAFIREYKLFERVPTVHMVPEKAIKEHMEHVILFDYEFGQNIGHVLELFPQTQTVYVVSGSGNVDKYFKGTFVKKTKRFRERIKFEFLAEMQLDSLKTTVSKLPENSILYVLPYTKTPQKKSVFAQDVLKMIAANTDRPIFTFNDTMALGKGIIGGRLSFSESMAEIAAQLVGQIINKESFVPETKVHKLRHGYIYDWRKLKKWDITEDSLPEGSIILNKEYSFVEKYRNELLAILFVIISQTILIVALLHVRNKSAKAEEKLRIIYNNSPDMYVSVAASNSIVMECNETLIKTIGYTRDEIIGNPVFKLYHDDCIPEAKAAFKEFASTGIIADKELALKCKDGKKLDVALNAGSVRDKQGNILHSISSWRDITDRKVEEDKRYELEKRLQQAQKLESIGTLAGGVAHDYNNITSIILGYSELLLDQVASDSPLHEDLVEIQSAAKRSKAVTNQLLAFARQETISPRVLDLNEAIENTLKMLQRLIGENIELLWIPDHGLWPVKLDPSQVDQVLANLCVNSRDAISDVGKIIIETQNIRIDEDYCIANRGFTIGDFVVLSVSDNGCGMTPQTQEKIFEPFFTTKSVGEGTGLGLSTVFGIVKQNEGFVNVYSEINKGSTIKIYFPSHLGQADEMSPGSAIAEEIKPGNGELILLVEDDVAILKLEKKLLEGLGYKVVATTSPQQAVLMAEEYQEELNLLLTDVVMPEMNGKELSIKLQRIVPQLKVLFSSGYTADVIAHRGVLEDGINFISKPFSKEQMAVKIRQILHAEENKTLH